MGMRLRQGDSTMRKNTFAGHILLVLLWFGYAATIYACSPNSPGGEAAGMMALRVKCSGGAWMYLTSNTPDSPHKLKASLLSGEDRHSGDLLLHWQVPPSTSQASSLVFVRTKWQSVNDVQLFRKRNQSEFRRTL